LASFDAGIVNKLTAVALNQLINQSVGDATCVVRVVLRIANDRRRQTSSSVTPWLIAPMNLKWEDAWSFWLMRCWRH